MKLKISAKALKNVFFTQMTCQVDEAFLAQVKRVYPAAYFAGVIEWRGQHAQDAWVKWHWYMTGRYEMVQIPLDSITTNIALVDEAGLELDEEQTRMILQRRVRRMREWERPYRQQFSRNSFLAEHKKSRPQRAPVAAIEFQPQARQDHDDGTTKWAINALGDVAELRHEQQFGAVAKLFRDKFGFGHTMAVARSTTNPNDFVIDTNERSKWRVAYQGHEFVHFDPRISSGSGQPFTWSQDTAKHEDREFWGVAREHGIDSGWSISSKDNRISVALCREGEQISADELALIEPNLKVLAHFMMTLMRTRLKEFLKQKELQEKVIPVGALDRIDIEIIRLVCQGVRVKVIADRLKMPESVIKGRLKLARQKLSATNMPHLVRIATSKGLLAQET